MSDFPVVTVEVAFVSDPLDDTPTFADITEHVLSVSTSVGRAQQFETFDPGTATLVLDNTDRTFDPLHGSGPHFSNLKPNKRLRVSATYAGDTYELFTGHVNGWPQSYSNPAESTSTVGATDAFKLLNRTRMPVDQYAGEVLADSPRLWYRLGETTGLQILDSSGNERHAQGAIDLSNVASDGLLPCSVDGGVELDSVKWDARIPKEHLAFDYDPSSIEFWFRCDKPPSGGWVGSICSSVEPGLYPDILITYEDPGSPGSGGYIQFTMSQVPLSGTRLISGSFVCDGLPHHVVCTRTGSTLRIYVDGINVSRYPLNFGSSTATVGAPLDINVNYFSGTYEKWEGAQGPKLDEFAIYDTALSQARIQAHYAAGALLWDGDRTGERVANVLDAVSYPSALTDIDTGQSILGPAQWDEGTTVLEYLQLVEATEQGQLFIDHANAGVVRFRSRATVLSDIRTTVRQAWLSDNDGDAGFVVRYSDIEMSYDDSQIVNRVDVEWIGGTASAVDQASIDEYGEQTRTLSTIATTKAEAEALASWVLNHTKDVFLRIDSVTVTPSAQTGTSADLAWDAVLSLQIGDWIEVDRHPQAVGTAISTDLLIEGIEHTIEDGVSWSTTFRCGPTEALTYWVLGSSELGADTRLAF